MTKEELSQLRYLHKEIELLKQQIADAEKNMAEYSASDVVTGSNPVWPYQKRSFHIEGIAVPELKRLKRKLQRRINELMDMREELEEYIDTVQDSLIRQILILRYVNGLSWQQVAASIGGGNTADSVRKAAERFLAKD